MDGTLIDSSEALIRFFKKILKEMGEGASEQEIMKYAGMKFDKWLKKLLPPSKKDILESEDKDKSYWIDLYIEKFLKYIELMDGAKEILETLEGDYKLALVTNSPNKMADRSLDKLEIKEYFDVVLREGDFERPKPSPNPLHMALKRLNLNKGETLYIGDTKYDKKAGKRAGIRTLILREDIQKLKEVKKFI